MRARLIGGVVACVMGICASAQADVSEREGWRVISVQKPYSVLVSDVKAAVKAGKMGVVTQAGPTGAAKSRGIDIPGNRVIGVFNNVFAVRILEMSTAAMIEAPIRLYVTETTTGATLSYKTPSLVFAPYMDEAGPELTKAASELDIIFEAIAQDAATR